LLLVIDSLTSSPVPSTGVGGYMHIIYFFSCYLCRAPSSLTRSPCCRLGSANYQLFR
jgi:hypothetical protein